MYFLIIVGPSSTGRRESEVEIRIRTYSDSITSVHRGAGRIEDYIFPVDNACKPLSEPGQFISQPSLVST